MGHSVEIFGTVRSSPTTKSNTAYIVYCCFFTVVIDVKKLFQFIRVQQIHKQTVMSEKVQDRDSVKWKTGENSCILLNSVIASEMSLQLSKSNVLINVEIFCKLKDVINIEYKMKRVMRLFTLCGAVSMFLSIDQLIN